jgi:hypothetical protein
VLGLRVESVVDVFDGFGRIDFDYSTVISI